MKQLNFKGVNLPAIGIGTWHMGDNPQTYAQEKATILYGLNHGATVIDTAEMYGAGNAEKLVGDVLQEVDRQKVFLISKFYPQNATKEKMKQALSSSLKRLKTDYLDLYLLHWRGPVLLSETVAGLIELQKEGKIRHWGVSNFDTADLEGLYNLPQGDQVFANEDLYNLANRGIEYDLLPWQRDHQLPLIAYAPIDQGDSRGQELTQNAIIRQISHNHQVTAMQILLAWTIQAKDILAIPQTSNIDHMKQNIEAGSITLSAEEMKEIDLEFPAPVSKQSLRMI
ncbi:Aldo/keto reductase family enzyme [Pediococcus damnosus]|uniref:aldo/keto reductase n=1 Tax=Pediococcus damnosus TaxID=51663 RepID=UPI00078C7B0B|nr:aldo/keto reductase [Pediococcus damnosus]AMV65377.1 Aldo/keto reductase family enzyme [Pediococcus damnosus]